MFDFREARDGEEAWEVLLLDPTVRVLITDLTMPRLDGYGLLQRIRSSRTERIRNMPVIVVSGSDEREERERAQAAGANDLITKGIATAQLLSRLDLLSKLVNSQREYEQALQQMMHGNRAAAMQLTSPYAFQSEAEAMLNYGLAHNKNFILLNICVGIRPAVPKAGPRTMPADIINAIGFLLKKIVRAGDSVARTGEAEFTLATGGISVDAARSFANRLCRAIVGADLLAHECVMLVASCGIASLCEYGLGALALNTLWEIAQKRGAAGLLHGCSGVVGVEEEAAFLRRSGRD
jgi:PleD family two-component response regulator